MWWWSVSVIGMRATNLFRSSFVDGHAGDGCTRLARIWCGVEVLDGAKFDDMYLCHSCSCSADGRSFLGHFVLDLVFHSSIPRTLYTMSILRNWECHQNRTVLSKWFLTSIRTWQKGTLDCWMKFDPEVSLSPGWLCMIVFDLNSYWYQSTTLIN